MYKFLFLLLLLPLQAESQTSLRLPTLLSDGAVLQRERPLPLWGWAAEGQTVTVHLGRRTATTVAGDDGRWQVTLPAQRAAGPLTLSVATADESVEVHDVWIGDVWLVSGQSNIDTNIERVYPQYPDEIDRDSTGRVRLLRVQNTVASDGVRDDVRSVAGWQTLSKRNAWGFSALGYFLGKRMAATTGVAQGVVQSSWGGTPIEAWLPTDSMEVIDPAMVAEAQYYADPELNNSIRAANSRAAERWNAMLEATDPGVSGNWTSPDFDDSAWAEANQYALPVAAGRFCGSYWLRQRVNVDAAHAGLPAQLLVGTLFDADYTYINGQLVGHTGYQYPPRRYDVPAGVLRAGDNVLTVRFVNHNGRPAFVREKPYRLIFADGTQVELSEHWRVHDGTQMPQQPSMPTGDQNRASVLWNGMLAPLAPMAFAGVVWYQGESNTGRAELYERELTALMHTWRQRLQQPELPFAIVHLAGYMAPQTEPQESGWPRLRESQRRAAVADAHAAIVPAHDLGEANDIHPLRKKEVAERAALVFDRLGFGKKNVPTFPAVVGKSIGKDIVLTFDQPLRPGAVHGFEVTGTDGRFHNVAATAEGRTVTLSRPDGSSDTAGVKVRYAWKNNPVEADCCARDSNLPAIPFELKD